MAHGDPSAVEQQQHIYESLLRYFEEYEAGVFEVEILPPALEPSGGLIQDGKSLGISKKALVSAFLIARQTFFDNRNNSPTDPKALQATKIMLLFDGEQLTAANFRKRRLIALRDADDVVTFHQAVLAELAFVGSILSSPLHRQTKSPTLWYHRAWLLGLIGPLEVERASGKRMASIISTALDSVCKAGERHPKNYYGWNYARRLVTSFDWVAGEMGAPFPFDWIVSLFSERLCKWCFKNPSDCSGWSYLFFLLMRLDPVDERDEIVEKVLKYAAQIKSENESLWGFVRVVLAHPTLLGDRETLIETLEASVKDTESDCAYSTYVKQSLRWIKTSGKRPLP
ncbi:hypothetical protein C7974DRAFT_138300 [Boeremia exigua]|uniref:uncharacterized protein n=1 Tax=Boeremia exigua TaxID=749465 RepID=UPI001E8D8EB4|nr:uncharacterized protein C7974DRAFT_138300 [Boeremia exigua]KAH6639757.1 hypothetical protein C7974DRAFT_138300 [Boeremia exigua]